MANLAGVEIEDGWEISHGTGCIGYQQFRCGAYREWVPRRMLVTPDDWKREIFKAIDHRNIS